MNELEEIDKMIYYSKERRKLHISQHQIQTETKPMPD